MANYTGRNDNMNQSGMHTHSTTSTHHHDDHMLTALFRDRDSAERAYQSYIDRGYDPKDINVIMSEDSRKKYYDSELVELEEGNKSAKGMGVGGAIGGTIGAVLGAIAAMGTNLVIPGLGLVVAGPLAAGLAGAGAGSLSGGLIGAMVGWGIPEARAEMYEEGLKSGGIVLGVKRQPGRDYSSLESDWKKYNAEDYHS